MITFKEAQKYIDKLNVQNFAGYSDWRVPTGEEAISLLEPEVMQTSIRGIDLFIDPIFENVDVYIYASDVANFDKVFRISYNDGLQRFAYPTGNTKIQERSSGCG